MPAEEARTRDDQVPGYGKLCAEPVPAAQTCDERADKEEDCSDHPNTLISRRNLAVAYQNADRPSDAIPVLDYERVLGPEHPTTVTGRANLAALRASSRTSDD